MAETDATLAKKVHIYTNGDAYFTGRRFVINPRATRNYDSFLNEVTQALKPQFGAVRILRTPENGHAVSDLHDLETGKSYVACAQKFVKLGYEEISNGNPKPKPASSPERRSKIVASGRIRKIVRLPITIFVYANGEPLEPPRRILLKPWVQKTWETILETLDEKIDLRSGAIRHLIDMNSKAEVTEGAHLKNNEYYVATGPEKFKDLEYGSQPVLLSPRQQQKRRYPSLPPLKTKNGSSTEELSGTSPSGNTNTSTKSAENSEPEQKPKAKKKSQAQQANNEEGIPIKPRKVKRSNSDKAPEESKENLTTQPVEEPKKQKQQPTKQPPAAAEQSKKETKKVTGKPAVDLDQDDGGVFKSKGKREKADEVKEDRNVKEEVPFEKRKAETVKDEQLEDEENSTEEPVKQKGSKKPEQTKALKKEVDRRAKSEPQAQEPEEKAPQPKKAVVKTPPTKKEAEEKQQPKKVQEETPAEKPKTKKAEKSEQPNQKEEKSKNQEDNKKENEAAIKIQAGYRGYKVRKEIKEKAANQNSGSDDDANKQEQAALTIQAGFRGFKVRKDLKLAEDESNHEDEPQTKAEPETQPENDEEKELAAIKIQAGFRGYKARLEVKAMTSSETEQNEEAKDESSQSNTNG